MSAMDKFQFPAELLLDIMYFAAIPNFSLHSQNCNIYADGLSLCLVSKAVRRVALRAVLHTIILPQTDDISKFIIALRMQKDHRSTKNSLYLEYAKYIRRISIGEYAEPPPSAPSWEYRSFDFGLTASPSPDSDISLLASVLLGASSLGMGGKSLNLLSDCLQWAWKRVAEKDTHVSDERAMLPVQKLPWTTSTFTVFGDIPLWKPLISTPEGLAFLASLSSIAFFPRSPRFPGDCSECYASFKQVPWLNLRELQEVNIVFPQWKLDSRKSPEARWEPVQFRIERGPPSPTKDWVMGCLRDCAWRNAAPMETPHALVDLYWEKFWACLDE